MIHVAGGRRHGGRGGEQAGGEDAGPLRSLGEVGGPPGAAPDGRHDQGPNAASAGDRPGATDHDGLDGDDEVERALKAMQAARDAWHARHNAREL